MMKYKELNFTMGRSKEVALIAFVNTDFYYSTRENSYEEISRLADVIINTKTNTVEKCRYPIKDLVRPFLLSKQTEENT